MATKYTEKAESQARRKVLKDNKGQGANVVLQRFAPQELRAPQPKSQGIRITARTPRLPR